MHCQGYFVTGTRKDQAKHYARSHVPQGPTINVKCRVVVADQIFVQSLLHCLGQKRSAAFFKPIFCHWLFLTYEFFFVLTVQMDFDWESAEQLLEQPESLLLDFRTPREYARGHLEPSLLIPTPLPLDKRRLGKQLRQLFHHVDRSTPLVLYCKQGKRAGAAKGILQRMGFPNVLLLGGVEVEPLRGLIARGEL